MYQSYDGVTGHRNVGDRDALVAKKLGKASRSIIDIGCNIGISLHHAIADGICDNGRAFGIDVDPGFVEYASDLAKKKGLVIQFDCDNLSTMDSKKVSNIALGLGGVDVMFLYSVWDYFGVSSGVLKITPNEEHAIKNIRILNPKIIMFEGHADGSIRNTRDLVNGDKTHESWKSVIENKLKAKKYELLGYTDNGRRPLYYCEMK